MVKTQKLDFTILSSNWRFHCIYLLFCLLASSADNLCKQFRPLTLGMNMTQTVWHWLNSWKSFLKELILKKKTADNLKHEQLPSMQRIKAESSLASPRIIISLFDYFNTNLRNLGLLGYIQVEKIMISCLIGWEFLIHKECSQSIFWGEISIKM